MDEALRSVSDAAWTIAPELGMIAAASLLVVLGAFLPAATAESRRRARTLSVTIAALVLIVPLAIDVSERKQPDPSVAVADDDINAASASRAAAPFVGDALARLVRPAALLAGLGLLVLLRERLSEKSPAEHLACLLFIIAGVSLTGAANDLIALFVALELISIPTYVLLYLSRPERRALEATTKYFLLSIFSSGFLLYGMSFLLGSAGSTNFAAIEESLRQPSGFVSVGMMQVALVLIVAGLGFRIAAVPFHFYAPDVFQGTTLPAAALLAVVPKIAGFVALLRLAWSMLLLEQAEGAGFGGLDHYGAAMVAAVALLTMTVGNVLALLQSDLRRLLAYSSVAHAGYMLVGLAVPGTTPTPNGAQAVLFYLLTYAVMTIGIFGVLVLLQKQGERADKVEDLDGLASSRPVAAILLAVFLLGLTGLPPTVGFWAKFNLFIVAWANGSLLTRILAIALALNAAMAAWYYLRPIKHAFLNDALTVSDTSRRPAPALYSVLGLCTLLTIGIFLFPNSLWRLLSGLG